MSDTRHEYVNSSDFPAPLGPYSAAVALGELVIVSGQGAADPATGELAGADIETQTEQVFKNLERILRAGGSDIQHILRCGVFLLDMAEFQKMNAVYERVMAGHRPARTTVQVAGLPMEGLKVEIDAIAYRSV